MTVSSWLMVPVWGLIQLLNALLLIFIVVPICYLFRGLSALLTLRPWRMQGKITVDPADLMWVKERAIINAFMVVDPINLPTFQRLIDSTLVKAADEDGDRKFPRFSQKVVYSCFGSYWEDDPNYHIERQIIRVADPQPKNRAELMKYIGQEVGVDLAEDRPHWQMQLIEDFDDTEFGGKAGSKSSVVLIRIHHCIGDGISLMTMLMSCLSEAPAPIDSSSHADWFPPSSSTSTSIANQFMPAKANPNLSPQLKATFLSPTSGQPMTPLTPMTPGSTGTQLEPVGYRGSFQGAKLAWQIFWNGSWIALRNIIIPSDKHALHPNHQKLKGPARAACSTSITVQDLKKVKNHLGITVNDVVIYVLTGALRAYNHHQLTKGKAPLPADEIQKLKNQKCPCCDDIHVRILIPMNIRKPNAPRATPPPRPTFENSNNKDADEAKQAEKKKTKTGLLNRFGVVIPSLPVDCADPVVRMRKVVETLRRLKGSIEPVMNYLLMYLTADLFPRWVARLLINLMANKTLACVSNLPGPTHPLYWREWKVRNLCFWAPPSGNVASSICFLTYGSRLHMAAYTDVVVDADVDLIVKLFETEMAWLIKQCETNAISNEVLFGEALSVAKDKKI